MGPLLVCCCGCREPRRAAHVVPCLYTFRGVTLIGGGSKLLFYDSCLSSFNFSCNIPHCSIFIDILRVSFHCRFSKHFCVPGRIVVRKRHFCCMLNLSRLCPYEYDRTYPRAPFPAQHESMSLTCISVAWNLTFRGSGCQTMLNRMEEINWIKTSERLR